MKIKYNIPKINELKNKYNRIKEKIRNNDLKTLPFRYYGLLIVVLIIGILTLVNNIKEYNLTRQEVYKEYNKKEQITKQSKEYKTVESSIYTTNSSSDVVPAMSTNTYNNLPVQGEIIKEFAVKKLVYSETLQMWKTHPGIDIKAEVGEEVISVCEGKVINIKEDSFYGVTVIIQDDNEVEYVYSNLDNKVLVEKNSKVSQGQKIGVVGVSASGEIADKSHLHFEIIKDKEQINPAEFLKVKE